MDNVIDELKYLLMITRYRSENLLKDHYFEKLMDYEIVHCILGKKIDTDHINDILDLLITKHEKKIIKLQRKAIFLILMNAI